MIERQGDVRGGDVAGYAVVYFGCCSAIVIVIVIISLTDRLTNILNAAFRHETRARFCFPLSLSLSLSLSHPSIPNAAKINKHCISAHSLSESNQSKHNTNNMPPMLTYAARVADGLPLVASFAPATGGPDLTEAHKREAKEILRGLSGNR